MLHLLGHSHPVLLGKVRMIGLRKLGTLIMAVDFIAKLRKRPGADVAM